MVPDKRQAALGSEGDFVVNITIGKLNNPRLLGFFIIKLHRVSGSRFFPVRSPKELTGFSDLQAE